jgi:hypothetical protein
VIATVNVGGVHCSHHAIGERATSARKRERSQMDHLIAEQRIALDLIVDVRAHLAAEVQ